MSRRIGVVLVAVAAATVGTSAVPSARADDGVTVTQEAAPAPDVTAPATTEPAPDPAVSPGPTPTTTPSAPTVTAPAPATTAPAPATTAPEPSATLSPAPAAIEGQVLSWMDPLGGATVTVIEASTGRVLRSVTLGEWVSDYRIDNLPAVPVKVRGSKPGYLTSFAVGTTGYVFTLVPGETLRQTWDPMNLYLDLPPEAVITGQVRGTNATTGWEGPVAGATVTAYDATTGAAVRAVKSDASGAYRLGMLLGGRYKLRAALPGWLPIFSGGSSTLAGAEGIDVIGMQTVSVPPLVMPAEAVLQGQVLGWMDPLLGATVQVLDATTGAVLRTVTLGADQYEYRIGGLAAGQVKVRAMKTGWITDYADNRDTFAQATVFTLVSGGTVSQQWDHAPYLYLDLTPGALVTGQVLGDGAPLAGATVSVLDAATSRVLRSVTSDATGAFRLDGLAQGDVTLRVGKVGWVTSLLRNPDGTPRVLHLEPYAQLTGLMLTTTRESVITGSVMGINDNPSTPWDGPVAGATVTAYDATTGAAVRSVATDALGDFRLTSLAPGQYKIRAAKPGYLVTFAYGRSTLATADVVTVAAGQTLALTQELVMYAPATITGWLMGFAYGDLQSWDDPLPGVRVVAIDVATGVTVRSAITSSADESWGEFRLDLLPPGTYRLRATKAGWLTTTLGPFTVTAGQVLDAVGPNVWPIYGEAAVSGQVLGWMDPLGGATVQVLDATTGAVLKTVTADGDGYYRVTGLGDPYADVPLSFKIRAMKSGWYTGYANGASSFATADVFTVGHGQELKQSWDPMVLYLDLTPRPS